MKPPYRTMHGTVSGVERDSIHRYVFPTYKKSHSIPTQTALVRRAHNADTGDTRSVCYVLIQTLEQI